MSSPSPKVKVTEATVPFLHNGETFHTFYKLYGDLSPSPSSAPCRPLVVLHGGPGVTHDYLAPLADLAAQPAARPVILYDQIGNGRSTHLPAKPAAFWDIALFVAELANLLAQLGISGAFDLLGHSWGGMLAAEFVVRRAPAGLGRLVLANSLACMATRDAEVRRLYGEMGAGDAEVLLAGAEDAGPGANTAEYARAQGWYFAKHLCRMDPMPEPVGYSFAQSQLDSTVTSNMKHSDAGKGWDIRDRLHLIRVPTLVLNGAYDFETDAVCAPFVRGIEQVEWFKFAHSAHMPHWEERERYMEVVGTFLGAHAHADAGEDGKGGEV